MTDNYQENISAFFFHPRYIKKSFKKKQQTELVLFEKSYG